MRKPRLATGWFLLASAPLLIGCGSTLPEAPVVLTQIRVERQFVPDALTHCAPEPEAPARTDEAVANYIVDLATAGRDCRAKLAGVRGVVTTDADSRR